MGIAGELVIAGATSEAVIAETGTDEVGGVDLIDGGSGIGIDGETTVGVAEAERHLGEGIAELLRQRNGDGGRAQASRNDDFADAAGGRTTGGRGAAGQPGALWGIEGIDEAQTVGGSGGAKGDQEGGAATGLETARLEGRDGDEVIAIKGGANEGTAGELGGETRFEQVDADGTREQLAQGFGEDRREGGLEAVGSGQEGAGR